MSRSLARSHIERRSPQVEPQASEESLGSTFALALSKGPSARSPLEAVIVDGLDERLQTRVWALRDALAGCEELALDCFVNAEIADVAKAHLVAVAADCIADNSGNESANLLETVADRTVHIDESAEFVSSACMAKGVGPHTALWPLAIWRNTLAMMTRSTKQPRHPVCDIDSAVGAGHLGA